MTCLRGADRRTWWRAAASVVLALVMPWAPAQAQAPAAPAFDAGRWLHRVQHAATTRSYQGTMVFSGGGIVSSSKVSHSHDGRQRLELIEVLDGQARQQFRHNDIVLTLWPRGRVAVFEPPGAVPEFPALPPVNQRLLDSYELRLIGQERMAGQETDVVMVKPRDALRFAQRLWAERDTGLLVRVDVLGVRGEVLESSAFTELNLEHKLPADSVLGPMKRLDGYRVVRSESTPVQLDAEGWVLQRAVAGFALVSSARRALQAVAGNGEARQVLQAVFSDGLTHVSMFIEPFDAQRHRPMRTSLGAAHTSMSRQGDWWLTVVGDVPMPTIMQFEGSLHRR